MSHPEDDATDPAVADTHASNGDEASASRSTSRGPRGVRAGDTLGRYELGDELGEGGMATVFRARDKELRRDVAVKVLFPHLARRDEVVRRFHREARAAAGLEHANILRIYDVGGAEGDDPPYIVMEMIRGRSLLAEIEQRGPMFAEIAACVGALLADALAAAHEASIVHRDMKPANVMIAPGGRILLTDFGVARLETEDSLVTKTGALLGTPAYMSPEQASGDTATAKSDIYSLGATLYQLATGTLPFAGSPAKVLAQIASGAMVAPVKKRAAVGPDLSRVIERMMAAEPEQRIASAAAAAAELRALAAAGGLGEPADELAAYFADPEAYVAKHTPQVVASTVTAAKQALTEGKLPRALALADRASSLAPRDPAVTTLLDKVAEGGRASRRNRVLAIALAGAMVAGGGTLIAMKLAGGAPATAPDAGVIALVADAAPPLDAAPVIVVDAPELDAPELDAPELDAGVTKVRGRRDAGVAAAVVLDASAPVADAAIVAPPPMDAAQAMGAIVVKSDAWCDLTIDKLPRGRWSATPIPVTAGRHVVVCEQPGRSSWRKEVDVAPGETARVEGSLLEQVEVTLELDATIDGVAYKKGAVAKVKRSRLGVQAGGVAKFLNFATSCHLRSTPELECYP